MLLARPSALKALEFRLRKSRTIFFLLAWRFASRGCGIDCVVSGIATSVSASGMTGLEAVSRWILALLHLPGMGDERTAALRLFLVLSTAHTEASRVRESRLD